MKATCRIAGVVIAAISAVPPASFSQIFTRVDTGAIAENKGTSRGSSWGDYDNDGNLDLIICNPDTVYQYDSQNFMYHNEGGGVFTKVTSGFIVEERGDYESHAIWGDYDNDGNLDLFIPRYNDTNILCKNQGYVQIKLLSFYNNLITINDKFRIQPLILSYFFHILQYLRKTFIRRF